MPGPPPLPEREEISIALIQDPAVSWAVIADRIAVTPPRSPGKWLPARGRSATGRRAPSGGPKPAEVDFGLGDWQRSGRCVIG